MVATLVGRVLFLLLVLLLRAAPPAAGQLPPILIGMTGPLTSEAGGQLAAGLQLAFAEANQAGGAMSRNLSLISLDDGGNPTRALANIQTLLDTEGVLLLAGVVGSDTAEMALPLILRRGVPYVGAYSGVASLHTPFHQEVVNVRPSMADEMVAQALFLVQYALVQRVACLYQNDSVGVAAYTTLARALGNAGLQVVASGAYSQDTSDVESAVAIIAGTSQMAQAVVMVATSEAIINFVNLFHADARTDPACLFLVVSTGWSSAYVAQLSRTLWSQLYFFLAVPVPGDSSWAIATNFANAYPPAQNASEPIAFEGYITGRLIVEVLNETQSYHPTSAMFINEVYNGRLFVLDDLVVGMYSTNYSGCAQTLCSCNSGLRSTFVAQLDPATGALGPSLGTFRYSVVACSNSVASVKAPLLFGQLLPNWDAGWRSVALEIGRGITEAFAEANAVGGGDGRSFVLLQQNYSSNATRAMNKLAARYPLAGLLGCVVPSTAQLEAPIASFGNLEINPNTPDEAFVPAEVHLQPATSLELMALAQWAVQQNCNIHLRASVAAGNGPALLHAMTQSVTSFQARPASVALYVVGNDMLSSTQTGCVIAIGSDDDVLGWYNALSLYPTLQLLTLSSSAMRLMAVLPNASNLTQATRLHFSTIITGIWNTTVSSLERSEAWKYGYVLGRVVVQALMHSQYSDDSYTTPAELLTAFYTVRLMCVGSLSIGPYYGDACSAGMTECECSEGARSVAVRSVASANAQSLYTISTCHVTYTPLPSSSSNAGTWAIMGAVVGAIACGMASVVLFFRLTKRNNFAAPKDPSKPFCVLFTDIQASTHLWATIPDVMAPALDTHHALIRKLIAKHKCYEVKTIGDSFMCVAYKPQQGMELSLAIQREFHTQPWTDAEAINAVYCSSILDGEEDIGRTSRSCWNGLRVRVGIHFGYGEIKLDPVSKGYDYYGTVVNTAARIESVCHGGQIGASQAVYDALHGSLSDVVWSDLGDQPLRGLSEPLRLYQVLPAGPLAGRIFPSLRLGHEESKQKALEFEDEDEDVEVVTDGPSSHHNSVHPRSSTTHVTENLQWVETHPMVMQGNVTAEDLKRHYMIALTTLSTLLTTQTTNFKEMMVRGLCERLHVSNYGVQGAQLQRTLRGLVHRVLPATVKNAHHALGTRHNSHGSLIGGSSTGTHPDSFRAMKAMSLRYAPGEGECL